MGIHPGGGIAAGRIPHEIRLRAGDHCMPVPVLVFRILGEVGEDITLTDISRCTRISAVGTLCTEIGNRRSTGCGGGIVIGVEQGRGIPRWLQLIAGRHDGAEA